MIFATTRRRYPITYSFDTRIQSKVENVMLYMGYGAADYVLWGKAPKNRATTRVKVLDRWGGHFSINVNKRA